MHLELFNETAVIRTFPCQLVKHTQVYKLLLIWWLLVMGTLEYFDHVKQYVMLNVSSFICLSECLHLYIFLTGQHDCCGRHRSRPRKKFNIGNFLTPHRGFDRLSQEGSDTEFDPLNDDSDEEEEYSITRKAWR